MNSTTALAPQPSSHRAPPVDDPVAALRAATHAQHEALDRALPLASDTADLGDYVAHLQMLRPWLLNLRSALCAAQVPALDAAARRIDDKLEALDADLADAATAVHALPSGPTQPRPASPVGEGVTARGPDLPSPSSDDWRAAAWAEPGFAWGLAYVVEGSQLGGLMLHRRLSARLAPHPLRYLAGTGGRTGSSWQAFLTQLRLALSHAPAASAAAQRGAVAAFARLMPSHAGPPPASPAPVRAP